MACAPCETTKTATKTHRVLKHWRMIVLVSNVNFQRDECFVVGLVAHLQRQFVFRLVHIVCLFVFV